MTDPDTPTVRERIGSLTQRLTQRLGRAYDNCRSCDRPTRSHQVGSGVQCHRCYTDNEPVALTDGGKDLTDTSGTNPGEEADKAVSGKAALDDAIEWFHAQIDKEIHDHTDEANEDVEGEEDHSDRPNTAREWFLENRGFKPETIEDKRLGWAPPYCTDELLAYLHRQGHSREEILASGVFNFPGVENDGELTNPQGNPSVSFSGRYIFPYFDETGTAAYAIARCTGSDGGRDYDGHPGDFHSGKYAKVSHTKDYVQVEEPIYGIQSLDNDGPVIITEGVSDAIRAHEYGYACLSPVTTQFKKQHQTQLADILRDTGRRTYIVQDAERAVVEYTDEAEGWESLGIEQYGEGLKGAARTAAFLAREGIDAYLAELPRIGLDKIDLDDYLGEWSDTLTPVLAGAKPGSEHPAYEATTIGTQNDDEHHNSAGDISRSYDSGEYADNTSCNLSADEVREALEHVPRPLSHHEWVSIGYAVHSWDSGTTGREIFTEWSRQSPKWDKEADLKTIKTIWRTANPEHQEGHTTVGTLIAYAKQGGWELPTNGEFTSYLPAGVRNLAQEKSSGWDWKHTAEQSDATISIDDARQRTTAAIADAYKSSDRVLIEALPTMGKSYGAPKAAKKVGKEAIKAVGESGHKITITTGRGNEEQYEQYRQWCEKHDLDYLTLPAFNRDCHTANGEHGEQWKHEVTDWSRRGATPQTIHKFAEDVLGRPLPCQEHKGQSCPYASKWDFDPDNYDVLIGHYSHAHKAKVTQGRTVVFDEYPGDAFETTLGEDGLLPGAVSSWLQRTEEVPFENWADLSEERHDEQRREKALEYFEKTGTERDELAVLEDSHAHALTPTIVFALLISERLGNDFEHADISDDGRKATYNREINQLDIMRPPDLDYASGIVALDGTPTVDMWEDCLGERLNHRSVLQDEEREEYIKQALNLNLIRTSEYIKPYNSANHVNVAADAALLNEIADMHDEKPGVITTSTAEQQYLNADESLPIAETKHYGNVLGSNEFKTKRVGAVIGSNHYGDHYIKKWAAYSGEVAEREGKGSDLDYGEYGNKVLQHMREHETLQAAMRYGRDGNGAVVYVHTNTLPDWVPLAGEGRVVKTWSDGMRSVIDALERLDSPTTNEIVEYPTVDISRQQVFEHCETLRDKGVLSREQNAEDGRGVVWIGDDLHKLGEHGDAELPTTDLDELEDEDVRQLAHNTIYTSQLTNFDENKSGSEADATISTQSSQSPGRRPTSTPPPD